MTDLEKNYYKHCEYDPVTGNYKFNGYIVKIYDTNIVKLCLTSTITCHISVNNKDTPEAILRFLYRHMKRQWKIYNKY